MPVARQYRATAGPITLEVYVADRCPEFGATRGFRHPVRTVRANGRAWSDQPDRLEPLGRRAYPPGELGRPGCVTRRWSIWLRSYSPSRTTSSQWQGFVADFLSRAIPRQDRAGQNLQRDELPETQA